MPAHSLGDHAAVPICQCTGAHLVHPHTALVRQVALRGDIATKEVHQRPTYRAQGQVPVPLNLTQEEGLLTMSTRYVPFQEAPQQCIELHYRTGIPPQPHNTHPHSIDNIRCQCTCECCAVQDHIVLLHVHPSCPPCAPCGGLSTDVRESCTEMATSSQVGDYKTANEHK